MNYLSEKKYDIYFITASQGEHPFSFDLSSKITCVDLNIRFHKIYKYKSVLGLYKRIQLNLLFKKRLTKKISEIDPDIIISTTYFFSDIICKLRCKSKKIVESHCDLTILGSINTNDNKLKNLYKINKKKSLIKCIELNCDALVCLTKGEAENWNTSNKYVIENPLTYYPIETSSLNNKMTEAINFYIENEEIRKEAGMKARANVDRFYPDIIMNKWNDLLQSLNCGNNIIQ